MHACMRACVCACKRAGMRAAGAGAATAAAATVRSTHAPSAAFGRPLLLLLPLPPAPPAPLLVAAHAGAAALLLILPAPWLAAAMRACSPSHASPAPLTLAHGPLDVAHDEAVLVVEELDADLGDLCCVVVGREGVRGGA